MLVIDAKWSLFLNEHHIMVNRATMAEWLRRWTRNPMGYSRAGSNPVRSVIVFFCVGYL